MHTKRVLFKKLKLHHANKKYANWFDDPIVKKYIYSSKKKIDIISLKKYISKNNKNKSTLLFGIFTIDQNEHIGNIKFDDINVKKNRVTMGILIGDRNFRGVGIFNEVIEFFSDYFFNEFKITNIYLGVDKKNKIAIKSYFKSGFKITSEFFKEKKLNAIYMVKKYNLFKKIIIGTAQFSKNYGINRNNSIDKSFKKKIINFSLKNNLKFFDTSNVYNEYKNLFSNNMDQQIILKIFFKQNIDDINQFTEHLVNTHMSKFNIDKFYGILIHNFEQLPSNQIKKIFKILKILKEKGITNKIGISIYDCNKIIKIINKYQFDILQCPFSIFDQRLLDNNTINKIKKTKIEIHARSIFLQGLLLKNEIDGYFDKWNKKFNNYSEWIKKNKIDRMQSALNFVLNHNFIDKIVIGFDSEKQINDILCRLEEYYFLKFPNYLKVDDIKLINPSNWK
tara:strand:- start:7668 stop:9017 length:1350 start_codon:yes stop_codon:yes gene_type:complete